MSITKLLIVPVILYGAVKGYILYNFQSSLDKAIAPIRSVVDIQYDSVFSTIDGDIGIQDIVIKPRLAPGEITISEFRLSTDNFLELLQLTRKSMERPPERFVWEVSNLQTNLKYDMFRLLSEAQYQQAAARESKMDFKNMDAIGCTGSEMFTFDDYLVMGYTKVQADFRFEVNHSEFTNKFKMVGQINTKDMGNAELELHFKIDPDRNLLTKIADKEPTISRLKLKMADSSYYKRRNNYCAANNNGSLDEYVQANLNGMSRKFGAVFPENLAQAYSRYLKEGGVLQLSLKPTDDISLTSLKFYKASDAMRMLGMDLSINGADIDMETIRWTNEEVVADASESLNKADKEDKVPAKVESQLPEPITAASLQPIVKQASLLPVRKSQLMKYLGKGIKVQTAYGERKGFLRSVDDKTIRIQTYVGGGEYTYPIKLEDIMAANVYY
ncbi:MAG: hypothetical protein OEZ68_06065 [Gammaproteobacteria bacterium]|nr:hypothetical protein [Gammaproteobacteria bacterium]MDH5800354.1 hypothetical protein [Gammaproteobacteria bacterium]